MTHSELSEKWAKGERIVAESGAMSCRRDVLYSWATPIAAIEGENAFFVTQKFSNHTSKQKSKAIQAAINAGKSIVWLSPEQFQIAFFCYDYGRQHTNHYATCYLMCWKCYLPLSSSPFKFKPFCHNRCRQ